MLDCLDYNLFKEKINQKFLPQKEKKTIQKDDLFGVAPQVGLEPTTLRLTAACSTG